MRMGRRMMRYAAACMLAVLVPVCAACSRQEKSGEEAADAAADGVLQVGIINGEDAYAAAADGDAGDDMDDGSGKRFAGIEPEIMGRLGEKLGVSIEYVEAADRKELMQMLDSGAVEVAAGRLTERDEYSGSYLASRDYGKKGFYLLTKRYNYADTLAVFQDAAVGVSDEIAAASLLSIPCMENTTQVSYGNMAAVPGDIEEGLIRAAVCTEREALALLKSGSSLQAQEIVGSPKEAYVFLLPIGQEKLCLDLNEVINGYLDDQAQEAEGGVNDEKLGVAGRPYHGIF